ncbi:hypothetical protein OGAPHI_002648 [Ogataea philodendri]|uniref:Ino eighty subunit 1 n=1 Tax=Ogataea philodendri TaxID=1378263 RepID=A0A9P8PB15_9ASCO|nr:uncharacterized protein OGAPHI_002648 [Ogataea philodendri]KAH3668893.1 hypothetical protein OGAPHI_002648 [Ogataea philodendri]
MSFDPVHDSITNDPQKVSIPSTDAVESPDQKPKVSDPSLTDSEEDTKKRKKPADDAGKDKPHLSALTNSRTRHLKKTDGEPYWRTDIKFMFLMKLFFNNKRVFKNPFKSPNDKFDWPEHFKHYIGPSGEQIFNDGSQLTFFELYLVTLMKSSKVSKVLKDRLSHDLSYALNFSIISILVNIGRLNTTVNFDYEMKSQFRTYHSVPSLHVGDHTAIFEKFYALRPVEAKLKTEDTKSYFPLSTVKPLQDTPRIKSILKSINDLNQEVPKNFKEFIIGMTENNKFNLNVVSLLFLLCVHEYEIGKTFFAIPENDQTESLSTGSLFNDIWLKNDIKSSDEVDRFLWLIYLFLETDFDAEKVLANPFNVESGSGSGFESSLNIAEEIANGNDAVLEKLRSLVPPARPVDETENAGLINDVDSERETAFATYMKDLRLKFLEEAMSDDDGKKNKRPKKAKKSADGDETDGDQTINGVDETNGKKLKRSHGDDDILPSETGDEFSSERKRKRKKLGEGPLKLSLGDIEAFLSADIRAGATSKTMINKRNKNHYLAAFLKDLILKRADDLKRKRLKMGHLNCMDKLEKLLLIQTDGKKNGGSKDKLDELQINYYKDLKRILSFVGDVNSEKPAADSFLDNAFANI